MQLIGFRTITLICLLGFSLLACTSKTAPTQAHPESSYEGRGHNHQPKND